MLASIRRIRALVTPAGSRAPDLFGTITQTTRAWPWLCDMQGHINNARYLDLMSEGREQWLIHHGLLGPILRQRLAFVVAGVGGVYRRAIPRMAPFALRTRVAAFDERWLYFEHTFAMGPPAAEKPAARFLCRGRIMAAEGGLSPREAMRRCGRAVPMTSPPAPDDLTAWSEAQAACLGLLS